MGDVAKALNLKTEEINGNNYAIFLLPASEGFTTALQITKLLAPALGEGVDGWVKEQQFVDNPNTFGSAATALIGQMDKVDVLSIIKKLLENSSVNGTTLNFDKHFAGNYGELIQVVEFALKENFSSFFMDKGLNTRLASFFLNLVASKGETSEQSSDE